MCIWFNVDWGTFIYQYILWCDNCHSLFGVSAWASWRDVHVNKVNMTCSKLVKTCDHWCGYVVSALWRHLHKFSETLVYEIIIPHKSTTGFQMPDLPRGVLVICLPCTPAEYREISIRTSSLQFVLRISSRHAQCTVKELHGIIRDSSLVNHHSILILTAKIDPLWHSPCAHGCSLNVVIVLLLHVLWGGSSSIVRVILKQRWSFSLHQSANTFGN